MLWQLGLLRLLPLWLCVAGNTDLVKGAPAAVIVGVSDERASFSVPDAIQDCLAQSHDSHGALLVFRDRLDRDRSEDRDRTDSPQYDNKYFRQDGATYIVPNSAAIPTPFDDVDPTALLPRTLEPLGLFKSIGRTFKNMPANQRLAVVGSAFGAVSVPAYVYNAAQGFDEEEISRLKAEGLAAAASSPSAGNKSSSEDQKSHESHVHLHEGHQEPVEAAKKTHGVKHGHHRSKTSIKPIPIYAVHPRDITVPKGKDVNIVINFETAANNGTKQGSKASQNADQSGKLATRGLASSEEAALIEKALSKNRQKVKVVVPKASSSQPKPNETVGKLLEYTGVSTSVLYTIPAINSVWRAALAPDTDLQKYRRANSEDQDHIKSNVAFVCVPYRDNEDGLRLSEQPFLYNDDGDETELARRDAPKRRRMVKRGLPSVALIEKAGKHAKTLGIGGIGLSWGYLMHNMGQRRSTEPSSATEGALLKRNANIQVSRKGSGAIAKRWSPGRGSILLASVVAGTGLAKAGAGLPVLHPTVVEDEGPLDKTKTGLAKRGVPAKVPPSLWSTIHRGLSDKVTIALGSMAASAIAVKSGLAGTVIDAVKSPFKGKTIDNSTSSDHTLTTEKPTEQDSSNPLEKRQLSKPVSGLVGAFAGVYLAQHLGSAGQERENKLYKQQMGLERRTVAPSSAAKVLETPFYASSSFKIVEDLFSPSHMTRIKTVSRSPVSLKRPVTKLRVESQAPALSTHEQTSSSTLEATEKYLDGTPRGRSRFRSPDSRIGADGHQSFRNKAHSSESRGKDLPLNPDVVEEIHVVHHGLPGIDVSAPSKKGPMLQVATLGLAGAGAGAFLHHKYSEAQLRELENAAQESNFAEPKSSPSKKLATNATEGVVPDDVLSKTEGKSEAKKAAKGSTSKPKIVHKSLLRPVSPSEDLHVPTKRSFENVFATEGHMQSSVADRLPNVVKIQHIYHHDAPRVILAAEKGKGGIKKTVLAVAGGLGIGVLGHALWLKTHPPSEFSAIDSPSSTGIDEASHSVKLQKRGTFNNALFGALIGTTGAATLYSLKHDEPGTRKTRHVPAGFLEKATQSEMQQPSGVNHAAPETHLGKRSLYSSIAKAGAKIAKSLPAWMKTSKAKGTGAIAGGLTLSTTAALMDDGPKEQKKKPAALQESPEKSAKNVFADSPASSKEIKFSNKHATDTSAQEESALQRRTNFMAPLKALKQLHADVVLHHGKTAGNALIVGGVTAGAGATGLLKRSGISDEDGQETAEDDIELRRRGAFGKNVFKMIDVASLAVPAGAIVGGLTSKAVHAVSGGSKGAKTEALPPEKRSVTRVTPHLIDQHLEKRKMLGMSNLGLASLATIGGGLLASPIKSLIKGSKGAEEASKGGEASAPQKTEDALANAKRDVFEDIVLVRRGAPQEIVIQAVEKQPTKVLGMSLLGAASMSTMFGFLLAPPIKSAWKKHKQDAEKGAIVEFAHDDTDELVARSTIINKIPDYSEYLDQFIAETHKKSLSKRHPKVDDKSSKRDLQQTIDYKFSKDGGEFKVSFAPFRNDTKKPKESRSNGTSAEEQTATTPKYSEDDSLRVPSTVNIHAHKGAEMPLQNGNATAESDKGLEIQLHRRGQHPSIAAHRQAQSEKSAVKRTAVANDTNTTSTGQDKIEYDVDKDGAHFEATFVARQRPSTGSGDLVDDSEATAPENGAEKRYRISHPADSKHRVASSYSAPLSSTPPSNPPSTRTNGPNGNTDGRQGTPRSRQENIENTVRTDRSSGVTTVTTRIAPARKRALTTVLGADR